jgi:acetylglutamate kinase
MMPTLTLVKIGGHVLDNPAMCQAFLHDFAGIAGHKILLHGGGKAASSLAARLHIPVNMHEGRRITDEATLDIAVMVYAGLINKQLVAGLQALQCNALGLSGADANAVRAVKRPPGAVDFGFVGDILPGGVNIALLQNLLNSGITPVIAPITHNGHGQLLNTNADTMAAAVAEAMTTAYHTQLIYCFEKKGVLSDIADENQLIPEISTADYQDLKNRHVVSGGMIPKLDNAFSSIQKGVQTVYIGAAGNIKDITAGIRGSATKIIA